MCPTNQIMMLMDYFKSKLGGTGVHSFGQVKPMKVFCTANTAGGQTGDSIKPPSFMSD